MTLFRLSFDETALLSKTLLLVQANGYGVLGYDAGKDADTLTIALLGSTAEQNLSYLGELEFFAERVMEWEENREYRRTYLERDTTDSGNAYFRTPIKSMRVELDSKFYHDLNGRKPEVEVVLEHEPYWESAEIGLKMRNPHVAQDTTEPIRVDNVTGSQGGSGDYYNYLKYDYSDHESDFASYLPYPLRLNLKSLDSNPIDAVLLCVTVQGFSSTRVYDAKDGTGGTQKPASPDYTLYQNGYYKELSISTSWGTLLTWTESDVRKYLYDPYLMIARWLNPSNSVRLGVQFGRGTAILSDWRQDSADAREVTNVGMLRTALVSSGLTYPSDYNLRLLGIASSATTIDVDYVELWPAKDVVEVFSASGRQLANGETLVVDGAARAAYVLDVSNAVIDRWVIRGSGELVLQPGMDGVLYFKMRGAGHVQKRVEVKAWGRRRTVA